MTIRFDVAEQFSTRPTLRDVASATLRAGLRELYPTLQISPDNAVVSRIPASTTALQPTGPAWKSLTDCLLEHFAARSTVAWKQDQYRLLGSRNAVEPLSVNIAQIGALVDRLAAGLLEYYKQAVADYWYGCSTDSADDRNRWVWLAERVKQQLLDGLDATPPHPADPDTRQLLRDIAMYPSRIERQLTLIRQPIQAPAKVCVVRLQVDGSAGESMLLPALVIFEQEQVIEYRLSGRTQSWATRQDWEQHLLAHWRDRAQGNQLQWTAFEPEDDIFDVLTQTILENQLADVQRLISDQPYNLDNLERTLAAVTDVCALFQPDEASANALSLSVEQLPLWLKNASDTDRMEYSRLMAALAVTQQRANGKSFNDGLPPILEFASAVLADEIRKDHPEEMDFLPEHIQVRIDRVAAAMVPAGGQPFAVGSVEPMSMTLPEFVLGNLAGLPPGTITVSRADSMPLSAWMTADYLKQLTVRANIGQVYPDLLKRYLVTDTAEAQRREVLFADQLRLQLPLKALEQKLNGELSLAGYQCVHAIMNRVEHERRVGAQPIVLRPLAFVRAPGHQADVVENMFVIGPADASVGPHVLYQPFSRSPLTEFSGGSALLAAITQPGTLQNEVLTWLSDAARPIYANGGFIEPHIVRFGLGSEFAALEKPQPAVLGTQQVGADILAVLFRANARALIELADRNAISNAESRWMILKEGGWLLLNVLLPLLGGAATNAVWLAQLLASAEQMLAAPATVDNPTRSAMLADVLLNLSLLLLHHGISLSSTARLSLVAQHSVLAEPVAAGSMMIRPAPSVANASLGDARTILDFSWSRPVNQLTERQIRELEAFKVWPSPDLGPQIQSGPHAGLFAYKDKWMASVGTSLFRVLVDDDGVVVVGLHNPERVGPRLVREGQRWRIDLSLRLRGGGPKKTVSQQARENAAKATRIAESMTRIDAREVELFGRITGYYKQLKTATGEVRKLFFERFESELTELISVVEQRLALWQELRPGDRPSERDQAEEIKRLTSQVMCLEGMLLQENVNIVSLDISQMPMTSGEHAVGVQNVDAYINMFKKILVNQEKGVHWSQIREALWIRLRAVPKVGEEFWRGEVLMLDRGEFFTGMQWKVQRMMSLLELCFSKADILDMDELKLLKGLRVDTDLHGAFVSQAELDKPNKYSLQERIEVLESALRQYNKALDIAGYVESAGLAPEQGDYFQRFLSQFNVLRETTETHLSELIHENLEPAAAVIEHAPRVEQPRKKIIRTPNHRSFVGVLREGSSDFPGPVVDVRNPLTDKVITSWHQHADGDWVEIQTVFPAEPAKAPRLPVPGELHKQARELLGSVERSIAVARQQSTRAYEPEDLEDILVFKAAKFTSLADQMTQSSADPRTPADVSLQLARVASDLRAAALRLNAEGRLIRISMIKMQPPTAARVSYLHRHNEINIAKVDGRKNMSGSKRNDFVQEYSIRDKDNQLLWWAHFHYSAEDADAQAFIAAHLKLPDQRLLGYKALIRAATDNRQVVSIYRSVISREIAQRLFLALTL